MPQPAAPDSTQQLQGPPPHAAESLVQRFDQWLRGELDLPELVELRAELLGLDQERAA